MEGVYAVAECEGKLYGAPDRALAYPSNTFECRPVWIDKFYTYYIPVTKEMVGKPITVWALLTNKDHTDFTVDCYICPPNREPEGVIVSR